MNNFQMEMLTSVLKSKEAELLNLYVAEREVPAVDTVEIFPVLLVDTGSKVIEKMSNCNDYIIKFLNPEAEGNIEYNGNKYTIVSVKVTNEDMEKYAEMSYCDTVETLDLVLRSGLKDGVAPLMNIYIKRYTVGHKYSDIKEKTSISKRTAKQGTVSYNVYYGQPFNITLEMARLATELKGSETVQVSRVATGKRLRSL